MAQRVVSQRELFTFIHEREYRSAELMLRSFPRASFDPRIANLASARDRTLAFIRQEELLAEVSGSRPKTEAPSWPASPEDLLECFRAAHLAAQISVDTLAEQDWQQLLYGPAELGLLDPVCRGELLWVALEDLVEQVERLAAYRNVALRHDDVEDEAPPLKDLELTA